MTWKWLVVVCEQKVVSVELAFIRPDTRDFHFCADSLIGLLSQESQHSLGLTLMTKQFVDFFDWRKSTIANLVTYAPASRNLDLHYYL